MNCRTAISCPGVLKRTQPFPGGTNLGWSGVGRSVATLFAFCWGGLVADAQTHAAGDSIHDMQLLGPVSGQHFLAPASLRVFVSAEDINNWPNENRATSVEVMVDDTIAATIPGDQSEYWMYKTALTGVAAGSHRIWVRGHFVDGKIFDSPAALITVDAPPAYSQVVSLAADVALSGTQNYELIGTPTARIRINGNGFRIRSADNWTGRLTLKYVDVTGLGVLYDATPGLSVTTTKSVDIENCVFDATNALDLGMEGTATGIIRNNEFRSNMLMAVGQYPINIGDPPETTNPALTLRGGSTVQHYFQGNNVGLSNVFAVRTRNWLFGGTTDSETNVLMGPRVGIELEDGTGTHIRRNISDQLYTGGWSQGNNFEMNSGSDLVVEENLISGGSWPVRGFGGMFRYNLVLNAGHEWLWITQNNAVVHHNIFAEGDVDVGGVWMIYGPTGVQFYNNTLDGFASTAQQIPFIAGDQSTGTIHSNVFYRFNGTPVLERDGAVATNYNLFYNPGVASIKNYSDNAHPANDVGALNAQVDPKFTRPQPPRYVTLSRADIWNRVLTLKQILQTYRQYYLPATGSPLIDAGDPAGGTGNDIGAVGAGVANPADRFGVFDVEGVVAPSNVVITITIL